MKREEFIAAIKPACLASEKRYGIPWGWLVGEAIQETGGYGLSDVAVNAHNLFGTKSQSPGNYKGYAPFVDWTDSIMYQGWQLNQHLYLPFKPLVVAGKFKEYGNAIQKAGYCDPKGAPYGDAIQSLAEQYDLLPKPKIALDSAEQWAFDSGIVNNAEDFENNPQVDLKRVCWMLYKSRGKI